MLGGLPGPELGGIKIFFRFFSFFNFFLRSLYSRHLRGSRSFKIIMRNNLLGMPRVCFEFDSVGGPSYNAI